jgi:hypothetical protein
LLFGIAGGLLAPSYRFSPQFGLFEPTYVDVLANPCANIIMVGIFGLIAFLAK